MCPLGALSLKTKEITMIKYIFNTSLRQEVIIDTDSNIDGYQYHYINPKFR